MNRCLILIAGLAAALLPLALSAQEDSYLWSFDRDMAGKLPQRFAGPVEWAVAADANAPTRPNVLVADASSLTNGLGSICNVEKLQLGTGQLWVRLRIDSGAAGILFRQRAPDTFCKLTADAGQNRLALTVVRAGVAQELGACILKSTFSRWHRIGVELDGRSIRCYFDGEIKLTAQDEMLVPSSRDGNGVGVILSSGGRARFDDLTADVAAHVEEARRTEPTVEVILTKEKIFLKENAVTLTELTEYLTKRFEKTQRLVLRVDKNVDYERIEQLLKAGGAIGFEKISIDLRP